MGKQNEALKLAIKDELIGEFRSVGAGNGALIPTDWLYEDFLPSLSRKEERALEETVAEMIEGQRRKSDARQPAHQREELVGATAPAVHEHHGRTLACLVGL